MYISQHEHAHAHTPLPFESRHLVLFALSSVCKINLTFPHYKKKVSGLLVSPHVYILLEGNSWTKTAPDYAMWLIFFLCSNFFFLLIISKRNGAKWSISHHQENRYFLNDKVNSQKLYHNLLVKFLCVRCCCCCGPRNLNISY